MGFGFSRAVPRVWRVPDGGLLSKASDFLGSMASFVEYELKTTPTMTQIEFAEQVDSGFRVGVLC